MASKLSEVASSRELDNFIEALSLVRTDIGTSDTTNAAIKKLYERDSAILAPIIKPLYLKILDERSINVHDCGLTVFVTGNTYKCRELLTSLHGNYEQNATYGAGWRLQKVHKAKLEAFAEGKITGADIMRVKLDTSDMNAKYLDYYITQKKTPYNDGEMKRLRSVVSGVYRLAGDLVLAFLCIDNSRSALEKLRDSYKSDLSRIEKGKQFAILRHIDRTRPHNYTHNVHYSFMTTDVSSPEGRIADDADRQAVKLALEREIDRISVALDDV